MSPSTVARIEKGRIEPTLDLLLRLCHACGLELRMRLTTRDRADEPLPSFDFERRLDELHRMSVFALEAERSRLSGAG